MRRDAVPLPNPLYAWAMRAPGVWLAVSLAATLGLLVLLFAAAMLDGGLADFLPNFYYKGFNIPVLTGYVLLGQRPLARLTQGAATVVRGLTPLDEGRYVRAVLMERVRRRFYEVLAVVVGALASLLFQLELGWPPRDWLGWYGVAGTAILFALAASVIYALAADMGFFAALLRDTLRRHAIRYDIFRPEALKPIADWSLGTTLFFLVGATASTLLMPLPELGSHLSVLAVHGTIVLVGVVTFFLCLNSTHRVMQWAKEREREQVRVQLDEAYRALQVSAQEGQMAERGALANEVAALVQYEQRIERATEWPYTADIVRRLAVSVLIPTLGVVIRLLPTLLERP